MHAWRLTAGGGQKTRLASLRTVRDAREREAATCDDSMGARVMKIRARQRRETEHGRGEKVDAKNRPLPMMNLHAHFGGENVAGLVVELRSNRSEGFDLQAEIKAEMDANFYLAPEGKGLAPYLTQYTKVSRKLPIPQPVFAQIVAHELAYSCSRNGNIAAEYRINSLRDLFSIDKVNADDYSEYSEEYVRAIASGLDSGCAAAKKDGLIPTIFGLIFDGNRFDPRILYSKDPSLSKEDKLHQSRTNALRLIRVQFEQAVRQVNIAGNPGKVAGVGLCGLEQDHSVVYFEEAFSIIHAHNEKMHRFGFKDKILGVSIHAGESGTKEEATAEVVAAIKAAWRPHTPVRIGHGVLAGLDKVREECEKLGIPFDRIHFEMCPTSNLQIIEGVTPDNHPLLPFLRKGGNVAAYPDNTAMSGALEKEPGVVGATQQDTLQMTLHSIVSSFVLHQMRLVESKEKSTIEAYAELGIDPPVDAIPARTAIRSH